MNDTCYFTLDMKKLDLNSHLTLQPLQHLLPLLLFLGHLLPVVFYLRPSKPNPPLLQQNLLNKLNLRGTAEDPLFARDNRSSKRSTSKRQKRSSSRRRSKSGRRSTQLRRDFVPQRTHPAQEPKSSHKSAQGRHPQGRHILQNVMHHQVHLDPQNQVLLEEGTSITLPSRTPTRFDNSSRF